MNSRLRLELIPQSGEFEGKVPELATQACAATAAHYAITGFEPPWIGYLVFFEDICVGTCAFKSVPQNGRVEIAYCTFPEFENHGYATAMVQALIGIAKDNWVDGVVVGQTLPIENASTKILKKRGFTFSGEVDHPEDGKVWEWTFSLVQE